LMLKRSSWLQCMNANRVSWSASKKQFCIIEALWCSCELSRYTSVNLRKAFATQWYIYIYKWRLHEFQLTCLTHRKLAQRTLRMSNSCLSWRSIHIYAQKQIHN
jgi:hypothetical protein